MKEFIEKIIEMLEEEKEFAYADFYEYLMRYELDNDFDEDDDWFYKGLIRATEIVNQLAEEYGKDTNVTTKDCLKCSRRLWYQKGYADAEKNNGWIPCSERLPEDGQKVLCSIDGNIAISRYGGEGFWVNGRIEAWMPLPKKFEK